jgi:hypothetical protein
MRKEGGSIFENRESALNFLRLLSWLKELQKSCQSNEPVKMKIKDPKSGEMRKELVRDTFAALIARKRQ